MVDIYLHSMNVSWSRRPLSGKADAPDAMLVDDPSLFDTTLVIRRSYGPDRHPFGGVWARSSGQALFLQENNPGTADFLYELDVKPESGRPGEFRARGTWTPVTPRRVWASNAALSDLAQAYLQDVSSRPLPQPYLRGTVDFIIYTHRA